MGSTGIDIPMYLWLDVVGYCDISISCMTKTTSKILDSMTGTDVLLYKITASDVGAIYVMSDKFWEYIVNDELLLAALWRLRPAAHYYILRKIVQFWKTENVDRIVGTYHMLSPDNYSYDISHNRDLIDLAIYIAIDNDNISLFEKLLTVFPRARVPLECVNSYEMAEMVIKRYKPDPYFTPNSLKIRILKKAALHGRYELLDKIISNASSALQSKINSDEVSFELLYRAVSNGYLHIVKLLIDKIPTISTNIVRWRYDGDGLSVMDVAVLHKQIKIIHYLKTRFPELNITPASYRNLIIISSMDSKYLTKDRRDIEYFLMLLEYFPDLLSKIGVIHRYGRGTNNVEQIISERDRYMGDDERTTTNTR